MTGVADISPAAARAADRAASALAMLEVLPFPALIVRADTVIGFANPAAQDAFMRSQKVLERSRLDAVVKADSVLLDLVVRVSGEAQTLNARDVPVEGFGFSPFHADVVVAAHDEDGAISILLRPRLKGRDLEGQVADPTGFRSMAAMGRTLAHEVKNPLAGIRGAAQLLQHDLDDNGTALAELIIAETDRISRLIDRMESFGMDVPLDFSQLNIHELLERVAVMADTGFGAVSVRRDFDPSLPEISGDSDQLVQVFLNLAKNAAEAALSRGDEGEVVISSAFRHGLRVRGPGGGQRDLPIEVAFCDNGPGVPGEVMASLFEPFITTKAGGNGLGLPLVQKIVTAHGGLVDFESSPGRTVFRVRLPATPGRGPG
jgi:two-component system, NtrC family, nitrogen regulation sensor histidine kinase GlnL